MREDVKDAILQIYVNLEKAKQQQQARGIVDQGERQGSTAGKHLNQLINIIKNELTRQGFHPDKIYTDRNDVRLPGWYRESKEWDMVVFDGESLVAAVELKSISSSFGNNANNRIEEALGSACDFDNAYCEKLLGQDVLPPVKGYALIVKACEESSSKLKDKRLRHFAIDSVFHDSSYLERFRTACERMRKKSIYHAVWLVWANPEKGTVVEPSPEMTFEKFIATITAQLLVHRA